VPGFPEIPAWGITVRATNIFSSEGCERTVRLMLDNGLHGQTIVSTVVKIKVLERQNRASKKIVLEGDSYRWL